MASRRREPGLHWLVAKGLTGVTVGIGRAWSIGAMPPPHRRRGTLLRSAYTFDNPVRRLVHDPEKVLAPYVTKGMTVLDAGCGMGFFSIGLARLVGDEGAVIATVMGLGYALGWPAVGLLGALSVRMSEPLLAVIGMPSLLVLSHLTFAAGLYLAGGRRVAAFVSRMRRSRAR